MTKIVLGFIIGLVSCISVFAGFLVYANALTGSVTLITNNSTITTSAIDHRKEFDFCPSVSQLNTVLSNGGTYSIEGCPAIRVYINNWDTLTTIQQTTIFNSFNNSNWRAMN